MILSDLNFDRSGSFFAAMYLSNLSAIVKQAADSMIAASVNRRHNYQSNRSYILNRIICSIISLLRSSISAYSETISRIIVESSKVLSIVRPDRKYGRYRKHTRRRYYNHMKSCIWYRKYYNANGDCWKSKRPAHDTLISGFNCKSLLQFCLMYIEHS